VRAATIAADIAVATLHGKALAQALGEYRALDPAELHAMEFWPLERRKLGARRPPPLGGQVALVTGGGGAIGHGIAAVLLEAGAAVVLGDSDPARLERARALLAEGRPACDLHAVVADVTDPRAVADLFRAACLAFGGVDVVVPNAGIAHVATLAEMDPAAFARVLEVNVTGTMLVLREAARLFARQQSGGSIVVQASKNVLEPGAGFGAYSASKAGVAQLARIAALELAPLGVRVNIVNADAVFGDAVPSGLWEAVGPARMRARGLDPAGLREHYRERSLLREAVLPAQVGQAVLFFAAGLTPTTGAMLPVDAGIPGAFPR
jgi:NAD(P)-dependent dehydrogenase (short-subunit alcohol dehydrogenase family)